MSRIYRTTDELVYIYHATQKATPNRQIADALNIPISQVSIASRTLDKYLKGKDKGQQRRSDVYREAVRIIRKEERERVTHEISASRSDNNTLPNDNLASLKAAFGSFQRALTEYTRTEANARYSALQSENKALKEENEQLKQKIQELKNNWLDVLADTQEET